MLQRGKQAGVFNLGRLGYALGLKSQLQSLIDNEGMSQMSWNNTFLLTKDPNLISLKVELFLLKKVKNYGSIY